MVFLEIATLIIGGIGWLDYYHTVSYTNDLKRLKRQYGEHPNIDKAFKDICTVGGEVFEMPKLVLDDEYPHINMGRFYPFDSQGPYTVLKEFFTTPKERLYFNKKYEDEVRRQAKLRNRALFKMYNEVIPYYAKGELKNIGSTKMINRVFKTPIMFAWDLESYHNILNDICKNTIWGNMIEAGPGEVYGDDCNYVSTWYIKEDVCNDYNEEVIRLLFECCYYHSKCNSA